MVEKTHSLTKNERILVEKMFYWIAISVINILGNFISYLGYDKLL